MSEDVDRARAATNQETGATVPSHRSSAKPARQGQSGKDHPVTAISRRALLATATALVTPAFAGRAFAQTKVLKIGAPLPLTGGLAPEGLKQRRGYEIWADAVNSAGGVKVGNERVKVELIFADYESNTPRAAQAVERMITQNQVSAVFGPYGSGAVKASSTVTERYRVPMLAPTASAREVYDQGHKFLFGTLAPNDAVTIPLARFMLSVVPNLKRMTILSRNDLFPLALGQQMEQAAKQSGIEVASFQRYPIGAMDHASALTEMAATKPDWVFVTGYTNDLILVRRQMHELKFTARVITMLTGPSYKEFIDALGPLAEQISSVSWWEPVLPYRGVGPFATSENYAKAYEKRYNVVPDYGEASSTACAVALQMAAEKAQSIDPIALRDALVGLDILTFYGPIKFGPNGQIESQKCPVFQLQGGKRIIVAPADVSQGKLQIIS
jgi:branched-chain amino acid transport system substrate-binding protein